MPEEDTTMRSDLPAISAVLDAVTKAVRNNDVDAFLVHCAPDVVFFDMSPPLQYQGQAALRRNWALALGSFEGPIEYELDHLDIAVSGDGAGGLVNAMIARMMAGPPSEQTPRG